MTEGCTPRPPGAAGDDPAAIGRLSALPREEPRGVAAHAWLRRELQHAAAN